MHALCWQLDLCVVGGNIEGQSLFYHVIVEINMEMGMLCSSLAQTPNIGQQNSFHIRLPDFKQQPWTNFGTC